MRGSEEIIFERVLSPYVGRPTRLQSLTPGVCRFCGHATPKVTFRSKAHVLPNKLGNVELLSAEECDSCNNAGGQLEGDLVSFLALERQIANMLAPGEVKTLRVGRRGTAALEARNRSLKLLSVPGDSRVRVTPQGAGILVDAVLPKFRPANIVRALARMAIFLARPEDLPRLANYVAWVRGKRQHRNPRFFARRGDFNFGKLSIRLSLRRAGDLEFYQIGFGYGTRELLTLLDVSNVDVHDQLDLPGHADWTPWVGNDEVSGHVDSFVFESDPGTPAPPPATQAEIAEAAYYAWIDAGRPAGRDVEIWLDAELALALHQRGWRLEEESDVPSEDEGAHSPATTPDTHLSGAL
jgi:hypothetical protein